jgi:Protein of unknown function (DUF992)
MCSRPVLVLYGRRRSASNWTKGQHSRNFQCPLWVKSGHSQCNRPAGALAGEYVGASGDIGLGFGVGANVLVGGSARTVALQPVSLEGSVAVDVALGVSALKLRPAF